VEEVEVVVEEIQQAPHPAGGTLHTC